MLPKPVDFTPIAFRWLAFPRRQLCALLLILAATPGSHAQRRVAVDSLRQAGFKKVKNMQRGILAWSDKVDPRVPKY